MSIYSPSGGGRHQHGFRYDSCTLSHRSMHVSVVIDACIAPSLRRKQTVRAVRTVSPCGSDCQSMRFGLSVHAARTVSPCGSDCQSEGLWTVGPNAKNWQHERLYMALIAVFCFVEQVFRILCLTLHRLRRSRRECLAALDKGNMYRINELDGISLGRPLRGGFHLLPGSGQEQCGSADVVDLDECVCRVLCVECRIACEGKPNPAPRYGLCGMDGYRCRGCRSGRHTGVSRISKLLAPVFHHNTHHFNNRT